MPYRREARSALLLMISRGPPKREGPAVDYCLSSARSVSWIRDFLRFRVLAGQVAAEELYICTPPPIFT